MDGLMQPCRSAKRWIETTRPTRCIDLGTKLNSAACAWTGTRAHPSANADRNLNIKQIADNHNQAAIGCQYIC